MQRLSTVLLIGSGRLATHLNHWFHLTSPGSKLLTWDRHQDQHALKVLVPHATHVWLAISDQAIIPFYDLHLLGHQARVVHFSGTLNDPRLIGAHPLMSFSESLYADEFYGEISFALTGCETLPEALPEFANAYFKVAADDRARYHALCVVAGNFPQMLWAEIGRIAEKMKIPPGAYDLYIKTIAQNFVEQKEKALTGPFTRRDLATIEQNAASLKSTSLEGIYQAFQKEFLK